MDLMAPYYVWIPNWSKLNSDNFEILADASTRAASRPRLSMCTVVVGCNLANRLALTGRENERNITRYVMDFHKLYNDL